MNVAKHIKNQILNAPTGTLWSYKDFSKLPMISVAKTLSRLSKDGLLVRVHKGVYYRPKTTILGQTSPDTYQVLTKILGKKSKPLIIAAGNSAFYNARLTTQVPAKLSIVLSDKPSRKINIAGTTLKVVKGNIAHLNGIATDDAALILSLRNIKKIPDVSLKDALAKIKNQLKDPKRVNTIIHLAKSESPRVRALIGAIVQSNGFNDDKLQQLKKTLNPLSKYNLGVKQFLPTAQDWNII